MTTSDFPHTSIPVRNWLGLTAFMVFAMAVIGAITRLTESGLSMVEWRPLMGAIPPLSEAEWERVFALYQQTPQYQKVTFGMEMAEFKSIFFWEWFHRLWGRMIGLIYALPLVFFWVKGMIPHGYKKPLIGFLILGGVQGVMGYIMVLSGLQNDPVVSHYKLAAHLFLAFLVFCFLVWYTLRLSPGVTPLPTSFCKRRHGWVALGLLTLTLIWGAFVAGTDAGMIYNTWPHMGQGRFMPGDMWFLNPAWVNPFENAAAIQFTHRWLAALTLLAVGAFAWRTRAFALGGMVMIQFGLGIATLLTQVDLHLAATHQAGAFITACLLLYVLFRIRA